MNSSISINCVSLHGNTRIRTSLNITPIRSMQRWLWDPSYTYTLDLWLTRLRAQITADMRGRRRHQAINPVGYLTSS